MTRIEIHLSEEDTAIIEQIAKEEGRSRKKQCEIVIKKVISEYKHQN